MITFEKVLQRVLDDYEVEINTISIDEDNPIKDIEDGIEVCLKYLNSIREIVAQGALKSMSQEIYFFKEIKPMVLGQLIYFFYLQQVVCGKPKGTNQVVICYLKQQLKGYNHFLQTKHICYYYYQKKSTFHDEQYFVRKNFHPKSFVHHPFSIIDKNFSTRCDGLFADFNAHEKIIDYLLSQINTLEAYANNQSFNRRQGCSQYSWTDNKVSISELAYALVESRSVNHGDVDVKKLGEYIGKMFEVEDVDIYRSFIDIQNRSNHTVFLDKMKYALLKKIENSLKKK